MSWSTPFDEPIELPKGRKLVTLKDAATYITKLPKAETRRLNLVATSNRKNPAKASVSIGVQILQAE